MQQKQAIDSHDDTAAQIKTTRPIKPGRKIVAA